MSITAAQLHAVMWKLPLSKCELYLPDLNAATHQFEISSSALREAAFLAQVAEESLQLTAWTEFGTGEEYEGRADLGNTQPGDGPRFRGRGPLQLTGRRNYQEFGTLLGVDLVADPGLVAEPRYGFLTAGLYWQRKGLNGLADAGRFADITRRINGGLNGERTREAYFRHAKQVLGVLR